VTIASREGELECKRAVVSLPLGVLQSSLRGDEGAVQFEPGIDAKAQALGALGLGHVARLSMRFRAPFWEASPMRDSGGFVLIPGALFPVMWTGVSRRSHVLTLWAGGPASRPLLDLDRNELVERALSILGRAFAIARPELEKSLVDGATHPWSKDPLSCASYSYPRVGGADAGDALAAPLDDTLFFAGEAACAPPENGTVEGALASGRRAAREILAR
jgi:monoamine oxidase